MFKFIRRVSTSLLPRPDRPWRDDATSNAPTIGRKRRFSRTEDDDSASTSVKKARGGSVQAEANTPQVPEQKEGEDVKSVTQGVKDVELEDKDKVDSPSGPEGIPLPGSPGGTPPPDIKLAEEEAIATTPEEVEDDSDDDSVASSSCQCKEIYEQGKHEDDPNNDTTATPVSAASPLIEDAPSIHTDDTPSPTDTDV